MSKPADGWRGKEDGRIVEFLAVAFGAKLR
jgi:hypothetical protein